MYKIYNRLYPDHFDLKCRTHIDLDYFLLFRNSELFEFTKNLEESDIVLSCADNIVEADDHIWFHDVRRNFLRHSFRNKAVWDRFREARSINSNFNPILLFVDSNWHLAENHGPNIQYIRIIDDLKKLTDVPFRKVLATHCNSWVDRHQLFTQPLQSDLIEKYKVTQEEYESLAQTLRENFIYTDYLFDRSYAAHFDFNLMQNLFSTVAQRNHWWNPLTRKHDINKFLLSQDHEIINPELVRLTCGNTHHDGPTMEQYLTHKNGNYDPCDIYKGYEFVPDVPDPSTIKNDSVRIFVSPSRTAYWYHDNQEPYHCRGFLRRKLLDTLQKHIGYIGDEARGNRLISNTSLELTDYEVLGLEGVGYNPPHNAYYNSSSISFYVETLVFNEENSPVMSATEKTWTPILKGHFILPFGPAGFCNFLKEEYDIRFPDFLDLSYDSMSFSSEDNKQRFETYLKEVERICEMGGTKLYILKNEYHDLLIHNRNVFRKNGYKDHISAYFLSDLKNLQDKQ